MLEETVGEAKTKAGEDEGGENERDQIVVVWESAVVCTVSRRVRRMRRRAVSRPVGSYHSCRV